MRFNVNENTTVASKADFKNFTKNLETTATTIQELKQKLQKQLQEQFNVSVQELFKLVPSLQAIGWTQYSPHFNDGDECIFHVREVQAMNFVPEFITREYEAQEEQYIIGDYDSQSEDLLSVDEKNVIKSLLSFISDEEDLMHDLYGNHSAILITREETKIEDYSDHY